MTAGDLCQYFQVWHQQVATLAQIQVRVLLVVVAHGLILERKIGTDEVIGLDVRGEGIQAVHMLLGSKPNSINLLEAEGLMAVM